MSRNHKEGGLLGSPPCPVYLGIDPSLAAFGLTAIAANEPLFESWVYKSPHRGVERLIDITGWLYTRCEQLWTDGHEIRDIAIENGVFHSQSAAVLGELAGAVKIFCRTKSGVAYPLKVPPPMAKKYATDRGNARKNEVMLAVYKRWGVEFSDDNMADSYVLARIVRGTAGTKYEQDVLDKLKDPKFRDLPRV